MTNTHDEWLWTDTGGFQKNPNYVAPTPVDHLALLRQCGKALEPFGEAWDVAIKILNASHSTLGDINALAGHHLAGHAFQKARAAIEAVRKAGVE